jgi:N-acetylglucosaminyldiphosphoundecaprenol N-acetyl-beta-D-mannosaminyltransferase
LQLCFWFCLSKSFDLSETLPMQHEYVAIVPTTQVGGLRIAALDRAETARVTIRAAMMRRNSNKPCLLFSTANGQGISICAVRPEVRALFDQLDLVSADGMSLVFASRLLSRVRLPERVATTDAFHDAAMLAEKDGATFYMLGARQDVLDRAVARAKRLYPGLKIVGARNGYFSEGDEADVIDGINAAAPDVLWVGLGVPRQQAFLSRNRERLTKVGVAKTCGGLFDFLSGDASRAPGWVQSAGLEWVYRMLRDPLRLAPRYLITNPHAAFVMLTRSGGETAPFRIA